MEAAFAQQGLEAMSRLFPRPWPAEGIALALDDLLPLQSEAMIRAHKRVATEFPPLLLPPIGKVIAVVQDESRKISEELSIKREKEREAEKVAEEEDAKRFFTRSLSDRHGSLALKLIIKTVTGELSDSQVIEAMQFMDREFPGVGWSSEAAKMVSGWRKSGRHSV